jgi:V-type H+-transporting ATPase subunit a
LQILQLMIPAEAAHDTMVALGDIGMLQFKDLNADRTAFQRTFASQIKRCDEMARQLRFLSEEVDKAGVPRGVRLGDRELELDELEARLSRLESEVLDLNANAERLNRSYNELLELQLVLETAGTFFDDARSTADAARSEEPAYSRTGEGERLTPTNVPFFPSFSLSLRACMTCFLVVLDM